MINTHKLTWKQQENGSVVSHWKYTNSSRFQEDVRSLTKNKNITEIRCFKI